MLPSGEDGQGAQGATGSGNPTIAIGETQIASISSASSSSASASASSDTDAEAIAPAPSADYTIYYIIGGVLVLVIVGLIVYIAAGKKKNKPESADKPE